MANKLSGNVLKVGKIQEEGFLIFGGDERENNNGVGNLRSDQYRHERQQLTLSSNLFDITRDTLFELIERMNQRTGC